MSKINVLIFPAGEINSVELHDALSTCVNIKLWGASSVERHGSYIFENYISGLPLITAPNFIEKLNLLLHEKKIDVIFPTHDTVALFFAENAEKIEARIVVAKKETAEICRDKEKTYMALSDGGFIPKIYKKIEKYPLFIKPKEGQGAVNAKLILSADDVPNVDLEEYVICEYLPGEEYTVDCLTDKHGDLLYISPRSRRRMMAGISVAGTTENLSTEIQNIATYINNKLSFQGLWWFQIKKDVDNNWKLLEISTRCAGSMCLTRAKGVNLPLLSVYITMGLDVKVQANDYQVIMDRTLISRYKINYEYDTVYFDFDDTLIINNCVNLKAIWFLYQCQNKGIKVILLTKHANNIQKSLDSFSISRELFQDVIHLKKLQNKVDFINPVKSILIDNSFNERAEVYEYYSIPVFDVDGIEVLMDWKS